MADKLADLQNRRQQAYNAGSQRAVERQHEKGKLLARERIDYLLDEGSFVELDMLARHRAHGMGLEDNRPFTDGVITGFGTVDGRKICVFSQDFTVFGGALGESHGQKIQKIMDLATSMGLPVVGLNDGAGARIQEGVYSLAAYSELFWRNTRASGIIPQAGGVVDDLILYRVEPSVFLLVVNASNIAKDFAWLEANAVQGVVFENQSDRTAGLALQGPLARGDRISLALRFARAGVVRATATVIAYADVDTATTPR